MFFMGDRPACRLRMPYPGVGFSPLYAATVSLRALRIQSPPTRPACILYAADTPPRSGAIRYSLSPLSVLSPRARLTQPPVSSAPKRLSSEAPPPHRPALTLVY